MIILTRTNGALWLVSFLSLCLVGCHTPASVRQLTKATSANTAKLGTQLSIFAQRQSEISALRAENLSVAFEQMSVITLDQSRDVEALRLSGQTATLNLYSNLVAASERLAIQEDEITQKVDAQRALMLSAQKQLTPPVKDLASVAQSLAALAEEVKFKDQLKFLFDYGKDVEKGIKQEMARVDAAKNRAATNGVKVISTGAK